MVGTDHHPFDRLVDWVDACATAHPGNRFFVQYGASREPRVAEGAAYLAYDELTALLAQAAVVVCHGGPGTITDARAQGLVPICLPRDPARGEHVDGHQLRFAAAAARAGIVCHVSTAEEFERALADALAKAHVPGDTSGASVGLEVGLARARAAQELDSLMQMGPRRRGLLSRILTRR